MNRDLPKHPGARIRKFHAETGPKPRSKKTHRTGRFEAVRPALERIDRALVSAFGIKSLPQRSWLLESRVSKRATELGLSSFEEYGDLIERRPDELAHLFELIRIGETSWMRHAKYLDQLIGDHLQTRNRKITIWSAGCGTGQEAYSVAMLLLEAGHGDFHVMGTDLSEIAVEQAARGFYPEQQAQGLEDKLRKKYWLYHDDGIEAGVKLRRTCSFSRHNLLSDPLPKAQDAILCRNVLMYFEPRVAEFVLDRLISALKPGGLLVLGPSELGRAASDRLEPLRKPGGVIWRRPDGAGRQRCTVGTRDAKTDAPPPCDPVTPMNQRRPAPADEPFVLEGVYPDERITELEAALSYRLADARQKIVVDIDRADFLCDEAARVLLRAALHMESFGGSMVLRATRRGVKRWIQRCGLSRWLENPDGGGAHDR